MHQRLVLRLVFLVGMATILITGGGCAEKSRRACESDADCTNSAPNIYCDVTGFCNVRQCNTGVQRPCFPSDKGCVRNADDTYTCQGNCKAGVQFCSTNGLWSACVGPSLPRVEICDLEDNDCDGQVDNVNNDPNFCICQEKGKERPCYSAEANTSGVGICKAGVQSCNDNNRWGACLAQVLPGTEICDGKDNDCNGKIDDAEGGCLCIDGDTRPCYTGPIGTADIGTCKSGIEICKNNQWPGTCEPKTQTLPSEETCGDGLDNDCDGKTDEVCSCKPGAEQSCQTTLPTPCDAGKQYCNLQGAWSTCESTTKPTTEVCEDNIDNDCDGKTDEGCECKTNETRKCYTGPNNTADVGTCKSGVEICKNSQWTGVCDTTTQVTPVKEVCGDNEDNDCDGKTDEDCDCKPGDKRECYTGPNNTAGVGICKKGEETCDASGKWGACLGEVVPQTEVCDNQDNDCDGKTDETLTRPCQGTCPANANDDICIAGVWKKQCVTGGTLIEVEAQEMCDNKDNDCDGKTDEDWPKLQGICNLGQNGCIQEGVFVCDNSQTSVRCTGTPLSFAERCDGKDNNCDGNIDEGLNCKGCIPTYRSKFFSRSNPFTKLITYNSTGNRAITLECSNDVIQTAPPPTCTVSSWDLQIATPAPTVLATVQPVSTLVFLQHHPIKEQIALAFEDGTIRIIDTTSLQTLQTLKQPGQTYAHNGGVRALAWSPSGNYLASGSGLGDSYRIRLWDVQAGTILRTFSGHAGEIRALAFHHTSAWLVSGSTDKTIKFWDLEQGTLLNTQTFLGEIKALAVNPSPLKTELAVTHAAYKQYDQEPQIHILDTSNLSSNAIQIKTLPRQLTAQANTLSYNRDGSMLAASDDFPSINIKIWDTSTWEVVSILYTDTFEVRNFSWHPTKDEIIASYNVGHAIFSCPSTCSSLTKSDEASFFPSPIVAIAGTANHTFLYWSDEDGNYFSLTKPGKVSLAAAVMSSGLPVNLANGGKLSAFSSYPSSTNNAPLVLFGTDNTRLSSLLNKSSYAGPDVNTTGTGNMHAGTITAAMFSPHTGLENLISADSTGKIKAWKYFTFPWTFTHTFTTQPHTASVTGLAFSPDGYSFVSGSDDNNAKIWSLRNLKAAPATLLNLPLFTTHAQRIKAVAWSRDGKWIATAGEGLEIKIWNAATLSLEHTINNAHTSTITSLTFHPGGRWLVSGSVDQNIRFWDFSLKPGTASITLGSGVGGHTDAVRTLYWNPNGSELFSGGAMGKVIQWGCTP
ncbi:MAG: hypothetical protein H6728_03520 [Myxococcales bacterium]|nr:hypothetical protein [Myxococcales bacterium]